MNRNRLASHAAAALIAAAAGDALGWPQEPRGGLVGGDKARAMREPKPAFDDWKRRGGTRFLAYIEPVAAGSYSDDTQLQLAVARSLLASHNWRRHLTQMELPAWPVYQRGGGRAVLRASNIWAKNSVPWRAGRATTEKSVRDYHQAGANGVAMRIAPHVIWGLAAGRPLEETLQQVVMDGVTTHGHPRALIGAIAYAASLEYALRATDVMGPQDLVDQARKALLPADLVTPWLPDGFFASMPHELFASEWAQTLGEMSDLLDTVGTSLNRGSLSRTTGTMRDLGALDKATNGAGTVSAAAAIFLAARSGTRPLSGLVQAAFETESDTDTIASMTGALLGAIHGTEWLGALEKVQDQNYLREIGHALAHGTTTRESNSHRPSPPALQRELESNGVRNGVFVDGRRFMVLGREQLSHGPAWVLRVTLELEDGQTVCVDYAHRSEPRAMERPASRAEPLPFLDEPSTGVAASAVTDVRAAIDTGDVKLVHYFYERLLGRVRPVEEGTFRLNEAIIFEQGTGAPPALGVTLWLYVDDLSGVLRRAEGLQFKQQEPGSVTVLDPEGRTVVLFERS